MPPVPARRQVDSDLLSQIGKTPLLRINLFAEELPDAEIWAKAEFRNPGGSVKDRAALAMVEAGERSGALTPEKIILDSSSGNTAVAYAMVAAAKGYRVKLVLPANVSIERKALVAAYGGEIVESDPLEGSDGAIVVARKMYDENPDLYFLPDQYNNAANPAAHYTGTGPEIWEQTDGSVTHFVSALGTSGTFVGTSRFLKERHPAIRCISVQPDSSWHGLEGLKHMPTAIVPGIYDQSLADDNLWAPTEESYELVRRLAREQGVLAGGSSGANLWAAGEVARNSGRCIIVTILADGGERYLSTRLHGDEQS